ncbi:hypothetical protein GCM10027022_15810 [Alpinimonas psychrophila]
MGSAQTRRKNPSSLWPGPIHTVMFTNKIVGETGPPDLQTHPRTNARYQEPTFKHNGCPPKNLQRVVYGLHDP